MLAHTTIGPASPRLRSREVAALQERTRQRLDSALQVVRIALAVG